MKPKPVKPQPGQESVWDYPRPPRLEKVKKRIRVVFNDVTIADTNQAYRVMETSHPPVYYIPPSDIKMKHLKAESGQSWCEWKGKANYYGIEVDDKYSSRAAWYYPDPTDRFIEIKDYIAFYANKVDASYVDDEKVTHSKENPEHGGGKPGETGIRTLGPRRDNGFRDRPVRPLRHLSEAKYINI